jgi:protocatechuate 3,4-dioxygenase beta subunit
MTDDDLRPFAVRRRDALRILAGAGGLLLGGRSTAQGAPSRVPSPGCVLTSAQTEGPYFVDERLNRSDVRADPATGAVRPGAPLTLALRVAAVAGTQCAPLREAIVDIWQCDALGNYSDVDAARGTRFLRGYQVTDAEGRVRFTTIYPGAYPGRAVHIHFKIRAGAPGRAPEFTSQLYFDDALTDRVHAASAYGGGAASRRTRNARDGLYLRGGRDLTLDVAEDGSGYAAAYEIGVSSS